MQGCLWLTEGKKLQYPVKQSPILLSHQYGVLPVSPPSSFTLGSNPPECPIRGSLPIFHSCCYKGRLIAAGEVSAFALLPSAVGKLLVVRSWICSSKSVFPDRGRFSCTLPWPPLTCTASNLCSLLFITSLWLEEDLSGRPACAHPKMNKGIEHVWGRQRWSQLVWQEPPSWLSGASGPASAVHEASLCWCGGCSLRKPLQLPANS